MQVTEIRAVTKTRFKVYLDGQFAFVLYKGELFRYHLTEGSSISESEYQDIHENIVFKRAKKKALKLLSDMDRTEEQLRSKLAAGEYPEDIIDRTIEYVKSFGYINDREYIRRFIESKKNTKSRKEIFMLLLSKGLPATMIEDALNECQTEENAENAIREILRKKRFSP